MTTERCRICVEIIGQKSYCPVANKFLSRYKSVKQMILDYVPKMKNITNEDYICENCLAELDICDHFVKTCLSSEKKMAEVKAQLEKCVLLAPMGDESTDGFVPLEPVGSCVLAKNEIAPNYTPIVMEEIPRGTVDDGEKEDINDFMSTLQEFNSAKSGSRKTKRKRLEDSEASNVNLSSDSGAHQVKRKRGKNSEETKENSFKILDIKVENKDEIPTENTRDHSNEAMTINEWVELNGSEESSLTENGVIIKRIGEGIRYQCAICPKFFTKFKDHSAHVRGHQAPTKLQCKFCNGQYKSMMLLRRHMTKFHEGFKPYKCDKCNEDFSSKSALMLHDCKFSCNQCEKVFDNATEHEKHMLTHKKHLGDISGGLQLESGIDAHKGINKETKNFKCRICDASFRYKEVLLGHMKIHSVKKFLCEFCPRKFINDSELQNHEASHFEGNHECDQCDLKFATEYSLKLHTKTHLVKKFQCEQCPKEYRTKRNLIDHIQSDHMSGKPKERKVVPDICSICNKKFKDRQYMLQHIRTVHYGIRNYKCELCGLFFKRNDQLRKHERTHTLKKDPFRCELCYKRFSTKELLDYHFELLHKNQPKNYKCEECPAEFGKRYLLDNHIIEVHETAEVVNVFKCDKCPAEFDKKYLLNNHVKDAHDTPEVGNSYKCEQCPAEFDTSILLNNHVKDVHKTPEITNSYKCEQCPAVFGRKFLLDVHVKDVHSSTEVVNVYIRFEGSDSE